MSPPWPSILPEKSTVMNLAEDRYRFLVGFAAALVRGQTTLLPPSRAAGALSKIAREYGAGYCLVDGTERVEHIPSFQIPQGAGYSSSNEKALLIPIDHPALIAFTSGSTGNPHPHSKTWGSLISIARATGTRFGLKTPHSYHHCGDRASPAYVWARSLHDAPSATWDGIPSETAAVP